MPNAMPRESASSLPPGNTTSKCTNPVGVNSPRSAPRVERKGIARRERKLKASILLLGELFWRLRRPSAPASVS
jgi:hypothetical protein